MKNQQLMNEALENVREKARQEAINEVLQGDVHNDNTYNFVKRYLMNCEQKEYNELIKDTIKGPLYPSSLVGPHTRALQAIKYVVAVANQYLDIIKED